MTPIADRADSLSLLLEAAGSAARGTSRLVLIAGEAGMGKSHLIGELLARMPKDDVRARSTCVSVGVARNFGPLLDLAEHLGNPHNRDLGAALRSSDPIGSAAQVILHLPLGSVMVIEDIQNADDSTMDVLKYLFRRISESQILLVCTYRTEEVDPDHPLIGLFCECPAKHTVRFELPPLSRMEIAALSGLQGSQLGWLYRLSGGNPLFAGELARKTFNDRQGLPQAIMQLASSRLKRLSGPERKWIELLAALPPPHSPGLLARLGQELGLDLADIPSNSGFLARGSNAEFHREVMRLAVLAQMPEFGRRALQQGLLQHLQDWGEAHTNPEPCFRLALDCEDLPAIAALAIPASRSAEARGDLLSCVSMLARAMPHLSNADSALQIEIGEVWACRTAALEGISDQTVIRIAENIDHWRSAGNSLAAGSSSMLLAKLQHYRGESEAAASSLDWALSCLESVDPTTNLANAYLLAAEWALDGEDLETTDLFLRRLAALEIGIKGEAVACAERLLHVRLIAAKGSSDESWPLFEAAHNAAVARGMPELAARIQIAACDIALDILDLARAEQWAHRESAFTGTQTVNCWRAALTGRKALIALHKGQNDLAREMVETVLGSQPGIPSAFALTGRLSGAICDLRTGVQSAEAALDDCIALARCLRNHRFESAARIARIEFLFLADRFAEALIDCTAMLGGPFEGRPDGQLALWLKRLGHEPLPKQVAKPHAVSLELAGESEAAAVAWASAGHDYAAAMARMTVRGEVKEGILVQALQDFIAMGASAAVKCLGRIAIRNGIALPALGRKRGPYRAARMHPLGLTRREVEILRMIVDGFSNREIAERLSRSLRTVEHHVSAILGKMGMESRVQAALYAIAHKEILER